MKQHKNTVQKKTKQKTKSIQIDIGKIQVHICITKTHTQGLPKHTPTHYKTS